MDGAKICRRCRQEFPDYLFECPICEATLQNHLAPFSPPAESVSESPISMPGKPLPKPPTPSTDPEFDELDQMDKKELRQLAKKLKVANWSKLNTADLRAFIKTTLK
jgi:hypothetical protein